VVTMSDAFIPQKSRQSNHTQFAATARTAMTRNATFALHDHLRRRKNSHHAGTSVKSATARGFMVAASANSPRRRSIAARVEPQPGHGIPANRRSGQSTIPAACAARTTAPTTIRASAKSRDESRDAIRRLLPALRALLRWPYRLRRRTPAHRQRHRCKPQAAS